MSDRRLGAGNVAKLQVAWSMSTGVLRGHEGSPLVIGDTMYVHTPFPNNVFATTTEKLILGAMRHEVRRKEARRRDIQDLFTGLFAKRIETLRADCVAELTGPLIIDRGRNIGFCGLTERCDRLGAEAMHALLNRFFTLSLAEVHRYEGTVNQFLGDGFMALATRDQAPPALVDISLKSAPRVIRSASPVAT